MRARAAGQVVAGVHNPWVTTDTSFKEFEQMRVAMEPIMYQFGVDIMYNGARAAPREAAVVHRDMSMSVWSRQWPAGLPAASACCMLSCLVDAALGVRRLC